MPIRKILTAGTLALALPSALTRLVPTRAPGTMAGAWSRPAPITSNW